MTEPLALEDAAYQRAQDEVVGAHADLKKEHGALVQTVGSLLGGGWTGIAAEQFGDGWDEWVSGCDLVLDGLVGMGAAMSSAYDTTHRTDDAQGAAMAWLHSRLGDEG